jgi:hypothetical protein
MNAEVEVDVDLKEAAELSAVNNELAEHLGGDSSENLPVVIEPISTEVVEGNTMKVVKPNKMTPECEDEIKGKVKAFIKKVKNDPTDMSLSSDVYKIGEKAANMVMPHVSLYDELIANVMDDQKHSEVEGSRDYNILQLRRQLDMVNPAVLAKTPVKQKVLIFFNSTGLPGSDKIMDMIYERKETVSSSVAGIKIALLKNADDLDNKLADLALIYKGLAEAYSVLKSEIYLAKLIYNEIANITGNITDSLEKQNIEAVQADLTTQINSLLVEENMNAQFLSGSIMTRKLVLDQQNQIRILVRQMQNAVLANLGLRVVAKSLANSVNQSKALGNAIANTIADTAKSTEETAGKLQKARVEGYINLKKLQEGADALERMFKQEAKSNKLIIKQGLVISKSVSATTARLEQKVSNFNNT